MNSLTAKLCCNTCKASLGKLVFIYACKQRCNCNILNLILESKMTRTETSHHSIYMYIGLKLNVKQTSLKCNVFTIIPIKTIYKPMLSIFIYILSTVPTCTELAL